jgi:trimethylamine--corrinoid protein Co-methyltransferase
MEERDNFSNWSQKGGLTMEQRANAKYKELLEKYTEPPMDDRMRKELDHYIKSVRNA